MKTLLEQLIHTHGGSKLEWMSLCSCKDNGIGGIVAKFVEESDDDEKFWLSLDQRSIPSHSIPPRPETIHRRESQVQSESSSARAKRNNDQTKKKNFSNKHTCFEVYVGPPPSFLQHSNPRFSALRKNLFTSNYQISK
jgi:hypothetical protein